MTSQNFLYPLLRKNLKHIYLKYMYIVAFSITDLITHVLFLNNNLL